MKQFTFWNVNDTEQHATLRFCDDSFVRHLSRDKRRSVKPTWNVIGTWLPGSVHFWSKVPHLWVAATQLRRNGWDVIGAPIHFDADTVRVTSRPTTRATDPETLLGNERKRSLDRGDTAAAERGASKFGKRYTTDVAAMRAAILARKRKA